MSKLKISLSAIFMLILLGIFGGLASAAGTNGPVDGHFDKSNLQKPTGTLNNATIDNFGHTNSQKTHGNFQNNTNSCANCHSVHQGEDDMLLMKSSASELCMSCHDGTLGFYNVYKPSEAGVMYSQEESASMHKVDSDLTESAAFGASATANDTNGNGVNAAAKTEGLKNTSAASFECSSCHNPHGSANDRLLNEKVAGNSYGADYNVNIVGYTETITKNSDVPMGQAAIKLNLDLDPEYSDINSATNLSGLKIYKSKGIYVESDVQNPDKTYKTITAIDGKTQVNLAAVRNYRLNLAAFCGSCHTEYYRSREDGAQSDDVHYGHSASSTKSGRTCVSCHYAHGTDITLLRDTAGKTVDQVAKLPGFDAVKAEEYMKDVSKKGSNLKRFTNMAVCWACHQSTHAIANTPGTSTYPSSGAVPGGDYSGKAIIK